MCAELNIVRCLDPFNGRDAIALLRALDAENATTYGASDQEPVTDTDFSPPDGWFLIGYDAERPVACGAFRLRTDTRPDAIDAEIKRMYVIPDARGRGYGAATLAELETEAYEAGATRAILETGTRSVAAHRLYLTRGYAQIPLFSNVYAGSPTNLALAKPLHPSEEVAE